MKSEQSANINTKNPPVLRNNLEDILTKIPGAVNCDLESIQIDSFSEERRLPSNSRYDRAGVIFEVALALTYREGRSQRIILKANGAADDLVTAQTRAVNRFIEDLKSTIEAEEFC